MNTNSRMKRSLVVGVLVAGGLAIAIPTNSQDILDDNYETGTGTSVPVGIGAGIGVAETLGGGLGEVGTAQGDILEAEGQRAEGIGKGLLFKSLSARQYQEAIDKQLDNRRESVETYFELRDLNQKEKEENDTDLSSEQARINAQNASPKRLDEKTLDPQAGEIKWVGPLAAEALTNYRKPIDESFKKRVSPGEEYGQFDYFRVSRMVKLMRQALGSVKDRMDVREYVALDEFLERVDFEARFDASGKRVDF